MSNRTRGEAHEWWRGDAVTYSAVMKRLVRERGRAAEHTCACGHPARRWVYDRTDPKPRWGTAGADGKRIPYSLELTRYEPLCASCQQYAARHRVA
jgi:hypothetical protein